MSTSPIQRLLGRPKRSTLPQQIEVSDGHRKNITDKRGKQLKAQETYNKTANDLPKLSVGQPVLVRDYREHKRGWKEAKVLAELMEDLTLLKLMGNCEEETAET